MRSCLSSLLIPKIDHGQGGAQGLEDGLAIGLVLHGADTSQIIERLAIYEKVRRNRAASIQILSNVAFDDKVVPEELASFLEGRPVPSKYYLETYKE
jgi:salicylate hydroxylase